MAEARMEDRALARVAELTNAIRRQHGLPALTWDAHLADAAHWMAGDMVRYGYCEHVEHSGRRLPARIAAFGYTGWTQIGENVALNQESAEEVVAAWMNSPGHRRNILDPRYTQIGVGFRTRSTGGARYAWVQEFGANN